MRGYVTRRMLAAALCTMGATAPAIATVGYYRFPAIHEGIVVFGAEGDLWRTDVTGGPAHRLTSHPGSESRPAISPDGQWVTFSAQYEGPTEVYVMPIGGGLPTRLTYDGERAGVVGWTPDGRVMYATRHYSTLPSGQLVTVHPVTGEVFRIPLNQASDGDYDPTGDILAFTRFRFQGSYTKRYQGGTAQKIWRYDGGDAEAVPLTADHPGTSHHPMWHDGRIWFVSDRDGTLNLWSMQPDGSDPRQHTRHAGWDVRSPDLHAGRVVYRLGADLRIFDIASAEDRALDIRLVSDLDQTRERWIQEPLSWLSAAHPSPDGKRVALTVRGQIFVMPAGSGRRIELARKPGVRYRYARFMPDGQSVLYMSDESGEVEYWRAPANGVGPSIQLTDDGRILRNPGAVSPDGRYLAAPDRNQELWLYDLELGDARRLGQSDYGAFMYVAWSPDSRWLAYVANAVNYFGQIHLYHVETDTHHPITADRFDSTSPRFSPDGRWLYFLSDRNFDDIVGNVWGARQPEPRILRPTRIYGLALRADERWVFRPEDELTSAYAGENEARSDDDNGEEDGVEVVIDFDGIQERQFEVPVSPGWYGSLSVNADRLFWVETDGNPGDERRLRALAIDPDDPEPVTLVSGVRLYELSEDGKRMLIRTGDNLFLASADMGAGADLSDSRIDLGGWKLSFDPHEQWQQMYVEAWRLIRDYFYDPGLHGVDWPAVREKYRSMAERVTTRGELSDVLGEMIGELSTLHMYVYGGDFREGAINIGVASLGARLERDDGAGGYRVAHIYESDPDYPEVRSPLWREGVEVWDVIETINGISTLDRHPSDLLRDQAGLQVLVRVRDAATAESRDVVLVPMTGRQERELRYDEWEYTRRLEVEERGQGEIGYVHIRSMGTRNYGEWTREFYPVYKRQGLIVDVRHNTGGNIESWILNRLMRRAWMWWQPRVGAPYSNMQYAFNGHVVVLCDEWTRSDGEAFVEGLRRLGLGTSIGTRTWGGEIWLTHSNRLVDRGIATAAEFGVYGPEGEWLIEGHGAEPDIVVDNLPHATFAGRDAQLEAAIEYLKQRIQEEPVVIPQAPPYPDKSFSGPTGDNP